MSWLVLAEQWAVSMATRRWPFNTNGRVVPSQTCFQPIPFWKVAFLCKKKMPGCLNRQQFRWSARPFTKISLLYWRLLWRMQSVAEFEEKYSGNVTPLLLSSRTRSWRDLYLPKSYIFKKRDQEFCIYKYRAQDFCIYKYRALQHDSDTTGRVLLQIWSSIKDGPGNA